MKEIPDEINIIGRKFDIMKENRDIHGIDQLASARYATQKIWIDNQTHIQVQEESLLHEILEMFDKMFELDMSHDKLSTISTALYQVLSENNLQFG